jgi:hypothetical protein
MVIFMSGMVLQYRNLNIVSRIKISPPFFFTRNIQVICLYLTIKTVNYKFMSLIG